MKIDFTFETKYGNFSDALWFSDEQPLPSDADIETMKQERLTNWLTIIENPPVDVTGA